ncbi:hypothetical protein AAFF_G00313920 [Aldrovandia affinis]|uniref:Uncharacterized protein n=1 Tax=Aldrovandia affinis TaxID=143900 RepID=A0AAD7R7P5_9TELE|nr:hypothetical protein AAFF_G00313920 [Aldrovandia affinis]
MPSGPVAFLGQNSRHHGGKCLGDDSYWYNDNPRLEDQVHCLVTVVDANKIVIVNDEMVKKLREIRLAASKLGKYCVDVGRSSQAFRDSLTHNSQHQF